MDRLIRFGVSSLGYVFPVHGQVSYDDNFNNVMIGGQKLPGVPGVVDPYGFGRAPTETGNISVTYWAKDANPGLLTNIRDNVGKMVMMGKQPLFVQPNDPDMDVRWCWARLNDSQRGQNVRDRPDLRQRYTLNFRVSDPHWYSVQDFTMLWSGDGLVSGAGLSGWTPPIDHVAVDSGDTVSVTNNGNYPARCLVKWTGDGTNSYSNPGLRRYDVNGRIVESIQFLSTIGVDDVVEIDGRNYEVRGQSYAYLDELTDEWITIPPGTWSLEVFGGFTDGELTIDYFDTWV